MKKLPLVMHYSVSSAFVIGIIIVISGCNDNSQPLALSGDIVGYSTLYDLNGNLIPNDTGVTVSVEGENHITTTNSLGQWDLAGLTTGTYNIDISKSGYGSRKILDFQFVGGGQADVGNVGLYQIPAYSLTNLSDTIIVGSVLLNGRFSGSLPAGLTLANGYVFFDSVSSVSSDPKNYRVSQNVSASLLPGITDTTFSNGFSFTFLQRSGFSSGQTVYAIAYASSFGPVGYTDFATGNQVFTGLNPMASNVVSFIVP